MSIVYHILNFIVVLPRYFRMVLLLQRSICSNRILNKVVSRRNSDRFFLRLLHSVRQIYSRTFHPWSFTTSTTKNPLGYTYKVPLKKYSLSNYIPFSDTVINYLSNDFIHLGITFSLSIASERPSVSLHILGCVSHRTSLIFHYLLIYPSISIYRILSFLSVKLHVFRDFVTQLAPLSEFSDTERCRNYSRRKILCVTLFCSSNKKRLVIHYNIIFLKHCFVT